MQSSTDGFIQHYTGLLNLKVLKAVLEYVTPQNMRTKFSRFPEFMVVLIKLRLNLSNENLCYRFHVCRSTISRILSNLLTILDAELQPLILGPDREILREVMLECFLSSFGEKVAIITDCFEIFVERTTNLLARTCTWSQYKHYNTVKFLIGKARKGIISFISDAGGGKLSDKF